MKRKIKKFFKNIILILIIILLLLLAYSLFIKKEDSSIKVVDNIEKSNYILEERDTDYYKENYKSLKNTLKSDEVDMEEYAKYVSILFITDLYTISNKISKYDVGGTEFIYPDILNNYKSKVTDTIYKYIGNDSNSYPTVKNVNILEIKESIYKLNEIETKSYVISVSWDYEKDLGYDKKGIITMINKDDILYIVDYQNGEINE